MSIPRPTMIKNLPQHAHTESARTLPMFSDLNASGLRRGHECTLHAYASWHRLPRSTSRSVSALHTRSALQPWVSRHVNTRPSIHPTSLVSVFCLLFARSSCRAFSLWPFRFHTCGRVFSPSSPSDYTSLPTPLSPLLRPSSRLTCKCILMLIYPQVTVPSKTACFVQVPIRIYRPRPTHTPTKYHRLS
jgi:hypothetical protein